MTTERLYYIKYSTITLSIIWIMSWQGDDDDTNNDKVIIIIIIQQLVTNKEWKEITVIVVILEAMKKYYVIKPGELWLDFNKQYLLI